MLWPQGSCWRCRTRSASSAPRGRRTRTSDASCARCRTGAAWRTTGVTWWARTTSAPWTARSRAFSPATSAPATPSSRRRKSSTVIASSISPSAIAQSARLTARHVLFDDSNYYLWCCCRCFVADVAQLRALSNHVESLVSSRPLLYRWLSSGSTCDHVIGTKVPEVHDVTGWHVCVFCRSGYLSSCRSSSTTSTRKTSSSTSIRPARFFSCCL